MDHLVSPCSWPTHLHISGKLTNKATVAKFLFLFLVKQDSYLIITCKMAFADLPPIFTALNW